MKGSFTIEASLLLTLFLSLFSVILYAAFYYHDQTVLHQNRLYMEVVGKSEEGELFTEKVKDKMNEELLITTVLEVREETKEDKKEISYFGEIRWSPGLLIKKLFRIEEEVRGTVTVSENFPEKQIRIMRIGKD